MSSVVNIAEHKDEIEEIVGQKFMKESPLGTLGTVTATEMRPSEGQGKLVLRLEPRLIFDMAFGKTRAGYSTTEDLKLCHGKQPIKSDNGVYRLQADGLYAATARTPSDEMIETRIFIKSAEEVLDVTGHEEQLCRRVFDRDGQAAQDMADYERAEQRAAEMAQEIDKRRAETPEKEIDGFVAHPESRPFRRRALLLDLLALDKRYPHRKKHRALGNPGKEKLIIERFKSPDRWVVSEPYAVGCTAEEAIRRAKATGKARDQATHQAQSAAEQRGLPALRGSEKQVRWALQIRDRVRRENPGHPSLTDEDTAKFWIENRKEI